MSQALKYLSSTDDEQGTLILYPVTPPTAGGSHVTCTAFRTRIARFAGASGAVVARQTHSRSKKHLERKKDKIKL